MTKYDPEFKAALKFVTSPDAWQPALAQYVDGLVTAAKVRTEAPKTFNGGTRNAAPYARSVSDEASATIAELRAVIGKLETLVTHN